MKELVDQHRSRPVDTGLDARERSSIGDLAVGDRGDSQTDPSAVGPTSGIQNGGRVVAGDPLAELGPILAAVAQRDRDSAEATTARAELRRRLLDDFSKACVQEVRPAMSAVLKRLQQLGGDGILEEHTQNGVNLVTSSPLAPPEGRTALAPTWATTLDMVLSD
jgi:hypothetical protein